MSEKDRERSRRSGYIKMAVVASVIAAYLGAYVAHVQDTSGKPLLDSLSIAASYYFEYGFTMGFNIYTIPYGLTCVVAALLIIFFMASDIERRAAYNKDEVAGTAGFMSKEEIEIYKEEYITPASAKAPSKSKFSLLKKKDESDAPAVHSGVKSADFMVMSQNFGRPVNSRKLIGNNNVLVVGGAGTGKSRFFIKPNMLQLNASYIITDPSGEMIFSMGKVLEKAGYKIKVFNISDMTRSNRYNPVKYIRDEAGVSMLVECFIKNTGSDSKGDNFFENAEKLLYSACLFYFREFEQDESKKTFARMTDLINKSSVDEQNSSVESELDKIFNQAKEKKPDSIACKYYDSFKQAAGKTLKSIIISCTTRLRPFLVPQVANLTKADEMDLESLGDEKTALFIITPQADRTYAFLASMLYSQMYETLYFKGESQKSAGGSEQMKIPVRALMDEFANIGEIPEFPSKLSTMRKYNISATIVLQDIAQIESMYQDDWKTLVGNCSSVVFLGTQEPNTLKYFSEMLGKLTVTAKSRGLSAGKSTGSSQNFQQTARELMTPDELGRMPSDETIVFTQNMRPVRDRKYDLLKHPNVRFTADVDEEKNAYLYKEKTQFHADRKEYKGALDIIKEIAEAEEANFRSGVTKAKDVHIQDAAVIVKGLRELGQINENSYKKAAIDTASNNKQALLESAREFKIPYVVLGQVPATELPDIASELFLESGETAFIIASAYRENQSVLDCLLFDYTKDQSAKKKLLSDNYIAKKDSCKSDEGLYFTFIASEQMLVRLANI